MKRRRSRHANEIRLLQSVKFVELLEDAARGKATKADVYVPWIIALAPTERGGVPAHLLTRWANLLSEEIDTVKRARNNVLYNVPLDDRNLAAAADIAEMLVEAAQKAGESKLKEEPR